MSKKELFQKAIDLKLIPEDANSKDYTVVQLEELIAPEGQTKDETLFEKAVRIKAVPTHAKESDYSENVLKAIIQNHEKVLVLAEAEEKAKKRYLEENKKEKK